MSVDERIHVLTLVDRLRNAGGAERLAKELALRLDPARYRSTLCVSRASDLDEDGRTAIDEVKASHVELLTLDRGGRIDAAGWVRLIRYLRRERVSVLHAHMFGSNVWGTVVGRLAGVPAIIAHEHTWSFEGLPMRKLLDRHLIARGADAFIAVSRADRDRMIAIEGIPPDVVRLIPNGIDARPPTGGDIRAEFGIGDDTRVIATACILRPQKRVDVLIDAVARIRPRFPDVQALVAGWGPEEPALREKTAGLGLEDSVRFIGVRADVPDVFRAADVGVQSSDYEGSPLAVMEIMEAGRPTVATCVGGVPDLIESGIHGILVPPGDPDALADGLTAMLAEPERAREMGRRAQERRRGEFELSSTVERCQDLYDEVLARRRRRWARRSAARRPRGMTRA